MGLLFLKLMNFIWFLFLGFLTGDRIKMYIYEERGLDKTGETNQELDCEYLFLFLCGFCCLDGIAGVLPDFFQNPLNSMEPALLSGRQNTGG